MSKLDPRIEAVRARYDLPADAFWQIPQNKQWVCKHAALEVVATKANVEWSAPQVIEASTAEGIAVMAVTGKMGDRLEWATGEASPKNNKNSYPWAMAEKRAKDRVILKLVGIHGLVYSEDEMPPEVRNNSADIPMDVPAKSSASLKRADADGKDAWTRLMDDLQADLGDCHSAVKLAALKDIYRGRARDERWPRAWLDALANEFANAEERYALPAPNGDAYRNAKDGKPAPLNVLAAG
jgi:hypothetical protein